MSRARGTPSPRRRILDAALELVATGGYDALQVQTLSDRAGVSSRTIYAHFPSLDSLVILAVAEQSQDLYRQFLESPPKGRTPAARVSYLIGSLTEAMTANREMTVALLRALLSGKPDVSEYVIGFATILRGMLAAAIAPGGPKARDREAAEILEGVWFTALVGWAAGTVPDTHIGDVMRRSARMLLPRA